MHSLPLSWNQIEDSLHTLVATKQGYSGTTRGIITLPDNKRVFVKIGIDEKTKYWANKEIATYRFLESKNYPYIPRLLAVNMSSDAFALEALPSDEGWDWSNNWTTARLTATLAAMDTLADIIPGADQQDLFATGALDETKDGWRQLAASPTSHQTLLDKLRSVGRDDIANQLDIPARAAQCATFTFHNDKLVHSDMRADNCAWNANMQQVRAVDWNWTHIGDRRIDINAFLANVYKAGLDVAQTHAHLLDEHALWWIAGYWLQAAIQPLGPDASEKATLRDYQLASGIAAIDLAAHATHK